MQNKFLPLYFSLCAVMCSGRAAAQQQGSSQAIFSEQELEIKASDGFKLYGTLTEPSSSKTSSTIVLIAPGSGATDRDGNQMMMRNNSIKMLSAALAHESIATLRYDKRGVGESRNTESNKYEGSESPTCQIFVDDISDWVKEIRSMHRFSKIVLLGYSEGALLSSLSIGKGTQVDGLVSVAGIGRPMEAVIKAQFEESPSQVQEMVDEVICQLKKGETVDRIPVFLSSTFGPQMQPYVISIMKINPRTAIQSVKTPILILQGNRDKQATVEDARILRASNPRSEMVIIDSMNHVLKNCGSCDRADQLDTYINPSIPINEQLVREIVAFINKL